MTFLYAEPDNRSTYLLLDGVYTRYLLQGETGMHGDILILMNYPVDVLDKKASDVRIELTDLDLKFNEEEDRDTELTLRIKIMMPVAFAAILVFLDTNWIIFVSMIVIFLAYPIWTTSCSSFTTYCKGYKQILPR